MKIAAITRFKQGVLFAALQKLGWTQSELARRAGIHPPHISAYMNLKRVPGEAHARAIQNAFGEAGVFVDVENAWPATFTGLAYAPVVTDIREVDDALLLNAQDESGLSQNALGRTVEFNGVGVDELNHLLEDVLDERERTVMEQRFYEGKTLDEIGRKFKRTRESVRQTQEIALKKLRRHIESEDKRCEMERMKKASVTLVENVLWRDPPKEG